jgi:hypothetical protein
MSDTTTTVSTPRKSSVNKDSANAATLGLVEARSTFLANPTPSPDDVAAYRAAVEAFRPVAVKRLGPVAFTLLVDQVNALPASEIANILRFATR